jgi:hypothetical protein
VSWSCTPSTPRCRWPGSRRTHGPPAAGRTVAKLGRHGIETEVGRLEHADLLSPQPPGVGDLEHGGVTKRGGPPLLAPHRFDVVVGRVEERLEFDSRQGSTSGPTLVLAGVHSHVLGPTDLAGHRAEPGHTRRAPAIGRVAYEVTERAHRLIAADRRMGQLVLYPQFADPSLEVPGQPLPRPHCGVEAEPAHEALSGRDGVLVQKTRPLLIAPTLKHRLECALRFACFG